MKTNKKCKKSVTRPLLSNSYSQWIETHQLFLFENKILPYYVLSSSLTSYLEQIMTQLVLNLFLKIWFFQSQKIGMDLALHSTEV